MSGGPSGERLSGEASRTERHAHPTVATYVRVATLLVILTVLEVGVFYVPAFHPILVPALLLLSAAKFSLVVMFYMHLKSDSPVFTFLLSGPLVIAVGVLVALLFLFLGTLTLRGAAGAG
jgi:cytochrome c oxidase subunit IV